MESPIPPDVDRLRANLRSVRRRIERACERVGRSPEGVRLVAVTKYVDAETVAALARSGVRDVGENRPQSLWTKVDQVAALGVTDLRWHMIGHLQRNKARRTVPLLAGLHAGDSLRLLRRVSAEVLRAGLDPLKTLVQVNVSGEDSKSGFAPDELAEALGQASALEGLRVTGLMTMAPVAESPEHTRPVFRSLRKLRDDMRERGYLQVVSLSMGMSQDFEVAIEEGATEVRVGSALYENVPR